MGNYSSTTDVPDTRDSGTAGAAGIDDSGFIDITVNGVPQRTAREASVATLLSALDVPAKGVAVAVNRAVIARSRWPDHPLNAGDRVDIVRAIGGG
jgi:sulfur carrier protein